MTHWFAPLVLVLLGGCATSRELLARGDVAGATAAFAREDRKTLAEEAAFLEEALSHLELQWGADLVAVEGLDGAAFAFTTQPGWTIADAGVDGGALILAGRVRLEQWSSTGTGTDGGAVDLHAPVVGVLTSPPPSRPATVSVPKYGALEQWLLGAGIVTGIIPSIGVVLGMGGPERAGAFIGGAFEAATSNERVETKASERARAAWLEALKQWSETPEVARGLALEAQGVGLVRSGAEVAAIETPIAFTYRAEVTWWHGLRAGFSEPKAEALADSVSLFATLRVEFEPPAVLPNVLTPPLTGLRFRCRDPNPRTYEVLAREYDEALAAYWEAGRRGPAPVAPKRVIRCVAKR